MNELGMMQAKCPKCGYILNSIYEKKCDRCKTKFEPNDTDTRFVDPRWN